MRLHWTKETFGYALRKGENAIAAITVSGERNNQFYGVIFESKLPHCGPFGGKVKCAQWVLEQVIRMDIVPADTTMSEVP